MPLLIDDPWIVPYNYCISENTCFGTVRVAGHFRQCNKPQTVGMFCKNHAYKIWNNPYIKLPVILHVNGKNPTDICHGGKPRSKSNYGKQKYKTSWSSRCNITGGVLANKDLDLSLIHI